MAFPIYRYKKDLPQWGIWKSGFTEDEVEKIVYLERLLNFSKGLVDGDNLNVKARNSDICFLQPDQNTMWIFQRLGDIIPIVNYDLFLYDIEAIETIQYTLYSETDNQFYDWHYDTHAYWLNYERKISGSVILSSPDEYEGGELEIIVDGSPDKAQLLKPEAGQIVFFASTMPHRVRPVTKGIRRTLVFWVQGKRTI